MIHKKRIDELLIINGFSDIEKDVDLIIDLAYENMDRGEWNVSAQMFLSLLSFDDSSTEAMNGLGVCLFEMGRIEDAEYIINRALSTSPHDPVTLANRASIFWEKEMLNEALMYYRKALEFEPNLLEARINMINLYRETGDIFVAYTKCLDLFNSFPEDEEIKDLLDAIVLDLAIMFY